MEGLKTLARVLLAIFVTMFVLIRVLHEADEDLQEEWVEDLPICDEYFEDDTVKIPSPVRTHHRTWNKYAYDSIYCTSYEIPYDEDEKAWQNRQRIRPKGGSYASYWRDVYFALYETNAPSIQFIEDSLREIARQNNLSKSDLAKMTVSFVQDIPYEYILPGDCDVSDFPCRDHEKFGILGPVEFLFSLSGDCDTRSVLLYTLLKNMGYSPLIVISKEYQHAMIALDIPSVGDYLEYRGRRFYFWETTNTGWLPGMLPPGSDNVNYWEISLDYEYTPFHSGTD